AAAVSPVAIGKGDQDPTDQPADMAAPGDVRDHERQTEVDRYQDRRLAGQAAGRLPLDDHHRAEDTEDRTRRPENRSRRQLEESSRGTGESRDEVEPDVPRRSKVLLDAPPDRPQDVHVEADVEQVLMEEHRGDEPIPTPMRHERP